MFTTFIEPLVAQWGLWAVFIIVMLESAGVPMPGETALVSAAIFAGVTGHFHMVEVIGVAALAAIIGDNLGFWVGRHWGKPLLVRYGHVIGLSAQRLALGEVLFARHGASIVFFGRFIAFLRIFAALLAGALRFGWGQFLLFNALGGFTWATVFGLGGYMFGHAITRVSGPLGIAAFVAAVIGVLGFLWLAKKGEHRFMQKLEREEEERSKRL